MTVFLELMRDGVIGIAEDDQRVMREPEQIDTVLDFEFGDEGRSQNFPHGWYLVPGIVAATGLLLGALALWN